VKAAALHVAKKVTGRAIVMKPEIEVEVVLRAALYVANLGTSPETAEMAEAVVAATDFIRTAVLVDSAGRVLGLPEGNTVGPGLVQDPVRRGRGTAGLGLVQRRDPGPVPVPAPDRSPNRSLLPPEILVVVPAA